MGKQQHQQMNTRCRLQLLFVTIMILIMNVSAFQNIHFSSIATATTPSAINIPLKLGLVGPDGTPRQTGKIVWYDPSKGWGHIQPDDGSGVIQVRQKHIRSGNVRNIFVEGEKVEYKVDDTVLHSGAKDVISIDPIVLSQAQQYMNANMQIEQERQIKMLQQEEITRQNVQNIEQTRRIQYLENLLQMPTCPSCSNEERIEQLEEYARKKQYLDAEIVMANRIMYLERILQMPTCPSCTYQERIEQLEEYARKKSVEQSFGGMAGSMMMPSVGGVMPADNMDSQAAVQDFQRMKMEEDARRFSSTGSVFNDNNNNFANSYGMRGGYDSSGGRRGGGGATSNGWGNNYGSRSSSSRYGDANGGLRRIDSMEGTSAKSRETRALEKQQLLKQQAFQRGGGYYGGGQQQAFGTNRPEEWLSSSPMYPTENYDVYHNTGGSGSGSAVGNVQQQSSGLNDPSMAASAQRAAASAATSTSTSPPPPPQQQQQQQQQPNTMGFNINTNQQPGQPQGQPSFGQPNANQQPGQPQGQPSFGQQQPGQPQGQPSFGQPNTNQQPGQPQGQPSFGQQPSLTPQTGGDPNVKYSR